MTLRLIKLSLPLLFIFSACKRELKEYKVHSKGYFWKLHSFTGDSSHYDKGSVHWVNACFCTQKDSVFYDSKHDLRDRLFVTIDSSQINLMRASISGFSEGDSVTLLLPVANFFQQQFNTPVPFFSQNDSVVKVNFKIKKFLSADQFNEFAVQYSSSEMKEIESFFGTAEKCRSAKDTLGFYWVQKPAGIPGQKIVSGDVLQINYEGAFLDGRTVDISPKEFTLTYGTPDQVLKGLNYVIARLKPGQDSKIILPSHLAFGENGSSNGSIPPFTPMLYKIRIISKK
jgi:FKBP-type peptidyl-prolyl cis-trans isomerase